MSRGFKINRCADEFEQDSNLAGWLKNFARNLQAQEKTVVELARERNSSIVNEINSIMSGKNRYATVDDAVNDMRERTGLNAYLDRIKSAEGSKKKVNKVAQEIGMPKSLAKYYSIAEDIESFVTNNIKNTHGLGATIPQLQYDILSVFGRKGLEAHDVLNEEVGKYLSDKILEARSLVPPEEHNPNIGDGVGRVDVEADENQDVWSGLMPAKQ